MQRRRHTFESKIIIQRKIAHSCLLLCFSMLDVFSDQFGLLDFQRSQHGSGMSGRSKVKTVKWNCVVTPYLTDCSSFSLQLCACMCVCVKLWSIVFDNCLVSYCIVQIYTYNYGIMSLLLPSSAATYASFQPYISPSSMPAFRS